MKNRFARAMATVIAIVGVESLSAQLVSDLPIGSTNRVLDWQLSVADQIWVNLLMKPAGSNSWQYASMVAYDYSGGRSFSEFIRSSVADMFTNSIDTADLSLLGAEFEVRCGVFASGGRVFLFGNKEKDFSLTQIVEDRLDIPSAAYQVDLVKAATHAAVMILPIFGVEEARVVARDRSGQVIESLDSKDFALTAPGRTLGPTLDGTLAVPTDLVTTGTPGEIYLTFTNGVKQTVDLATGRRLPALTLSPAGSGQLKLTIQGVPGTPYAIEASSDLAWAQVLTLVPRDGSTNPPVIGAKGTSAQRIPLSGPSWFFRARCASP